MRYFFLSIAILFPVILEAQLAAPGAQAVRYTDYPSDSAKSIKDPIFIYCNATGSEVGTLTAVSPTGNGPFDFSWFAWNNTTKEFSDSVKTEMDVEMSSITGLVEGGYQVVITGGFDTTLTGWIVFDEPANVTARLEQQLCERIVLAGSYTAPVTQFYYYDPFTGEDGSIYNEISFLWSSEPGTIIALPNVDLASKKIYNPPLEDVTYILTVDGLGCSASASFFYESIHIKADFAVDPSKGEAPLEVVFTDNSLGENLTYTWEFGDKTFDGKETDPWIITEDSIVLMDQQFSHTYFRPGDYSVLLTIENDKYCKSSDSITISVDPSELDIPNVFTPNGDDYNNNFLVATKSLRYLSVEIFSRSGIKVYSFFGSGKKLQEWTGWDGNINNTSAKAASGVYFYIIRALGWDDVEYDSKAYRGFVYLYR